jgi:outer membrane protein OmpA-like peptidoglycan-associated protein
MKTVRPWYLVAATLLGCASALPPKELLDARAAYKASLAGPAAQEKPADVHEAKKALDSAEGAFAEDGDSETTRDLAYIAVRKTQLADSSARATIAQKQKDSLEHNATNLTAEQLKRANAELSSTRNNLEKTQDQLAREKAAREAAEKKAAQALADLQKIAAVKQESRGMVITLSGSVLFPSNGSSLLPGALVKLNDVADALIKGNPDSNLTIEGHSDSQGQRDYNVELSQKRAEAVKMQLVARGVAADRIKTVGIGPERPIADNKTAEGRANNRRVEIVVEPPRS